MKRDFFIKSFSFWLIVEQLHKASYFDNTAELLETIVWQQQQLFILMSAELNTLLAVLRHCKKK